MTYFAFLALFIGIPLVLLSLITLRDYRRGHWQPPSLFSVAPWKVMLALCIVALIYTTPWDNYLVATRVWYYNPNLVTGIVFGWVPIEEYTFFIVLPILTCLWTLLLMRNMPINPRVTTWTSGSRVRRLWTAILLVIWVISLIIFGLTLVDAAWQPFTYLTLTLSWALIPIILQAFFGADILARHGRIVLTAIATSTLYLSATDMVAIGAGTWMIDPQQSLPILIGGVLPIEEFVFFLIVNVLVVFGLTLVLARESYQRLDEIEEGSWLKSLIKPLRNLFLPVTQSSRSPE